MHVTFLSLRIWWRCEPNATFADAKAAADKLLASMPPHEPYNTDCFRRDHDKLLWDPRYGKRRYGKILFQPASTIGEVYNEGDEIVCVQHLHKQWMHTCNGLSEARLQKRDAQRALAGAEAREDIVKQATREHVVKEVKVRPTKFNSWRAPKPIGGLHTRISAERMAAEEGTRSSSLSDGGGKLRTMSNTMIETTRSTRESSNP